jgi:murein DD-endopeptidase MepM/ murein hydrolase activator NlpD
MKEDPIKKTIESSVSKITKQSVNIKPEILNNVVTSYTKAAEAVSKLSVNNLATQTFIKYLPVIASSPNPTKTINTIGERLATPDATRIQMQQIFSLSSGKNIDVQQFFAFGKNPELARLFSQSFPELNSPTIQKTVFAPVIGTSIKETFQNVVTNAKILTKSINLPAWVLPTTFGVTGAAVAGPAGAIAGTVGGIAVTKIVSPNTQVLPEMAAMTPKVLNAGFEMAKNYTISSFSSFIGVGFVAGSAITIFTTLVVIFIQIGALRVPENLNPLSFLGFFGGGGAADIIGGRSGLSGQFCWPTSGSITQGPVGSNIPRYCTDNGVVVVCSHVSANEQAIDIGNSSSPIVVATHDGNYVSDTQYPNDKTNHPYGINVKVTSPDGKFLTIFAHLQATNLSDSGQIRAGEIIGIMGTTGNSSGIHLHYGVWTLSGEKIYINDIVPAYKFNDWVSGCANTSGTGLTIPEKSSETSISPVGNFELPYEERRGTIGERPTSQCYSNDGQCKSECKRDLAKCESSCRAWEMPPKECTSGNISVHEQKLDCPTNTVCCYNYCEK